MAARDLKVFIKTLSDVSGLTKLGGALRSHSVAVKALVGVYKVTASAGKAAFGLINAELRYLRNAAMGGAGALAVAIREGAKLNLTLAQTVNMASGNKMGNFVKFRKEILNLSSDVGIATDQITAGLYQALSAQMDPEQAFGAIRKAAQGVIADGAELKDVMAGIIAGVKSFGGDVDQTAEQLYRIVQLGQTTFGEVGQYLSQVAPVAAANKVSLGEVGGAIAQLTSKTIPLSQSVVMLRNMMSRLNNVLGDGWRESYTFQEAMEAVAKSANYSQVELGKLFGIEGLAGVNALVGGNFAEARKQAAEFNGELRGLADGAAFVDQFRGFAKIWKSIQAYVKDIGSEIETRWAPRIQFIAMKIAEMRKGEGWQKLVDTISAKLEATVTWAIVQVKTAADLIQHLRSQDFGMARMAEVGKTIVVELVTMAVTLLMALMKANISVFIGIAKIVAAAFKKEIFDVMKMAGLGGRVANASVQKLNTMDASQKDELAQSLGFKNSKEMGGSEAYLKGDLDSSIAAFESSSGVIKAMSETAGKLKDTMKDVDAQWTKSKANIKASAGIASGGNFNWDEQAADNREEVNSFMTPPPAAPASLLSRRAATPARKSRAQLEAELEDLKMKATAAEMDQKLAEMQTPEEQKLAKWQQKEGSRNYAAGSFAHREGQQLSQAAQASRQEINAQAAEAAADLASITSMMATLVSGIKDLKGQMQNQP